MPVKKDASGRRWVEMEFVVPGGPEHVWHAVATGPGMSAWFTPTTVEERVGGAIRFDFGDGAASSGTVLEWEPPRRLVYEEYCWNGDAPPVATEVVVTPHYGDRCVVRMVHSLTSSTDDWDDQLESFETGWPGFFEVLRIYLRHHAGQPAAAVHAVVHQPGEQADMWHTLSTALDLAGANVGERREAPPASPRLAGVVERVHQDARSREVMLRLDEPTEGVAVVGTCQPGDQASGVVSLFFYGADAAQTAAGERPKWNAWLADLLRAPATT